MPPDLSELMDALVELGCSFIAAFDHREASMRQIAEDVQKIADQLIKMQETTGMFIRGGGVSAGFGLLMCAAGLAAVPFTGAGASAAVVGGLAAALGRAVGVAANVTQTIKEINSAKQVLQLGEVFMELVQPLINILEEIKTTCAKLEEKSREIQAECVLTELVEFQKILSELRTRSRNLSSVVLAVMQEINTTLRIITNFFRVTGRTEEDKRLIDVVISSGPCCQKIIHDLDVMTKHLTAVFEHGETVSQAATLES